MGLVPLQKDEKAPLASDVFGQEFLTIGQLDMAGYITSTGASWAGNVEAAKFTLITERFERYFEHRGLIEETTSKLGSDEYERFDYSFPVHHPYWFRQIEPAGWKVVRGGVQWEYKDFKPKEAIEVKYYTTPFPRLPDEVGPFVDRFVKGLGPTESAGTQLTRLREVQLAVYGCEPKDPKAMSFASQQLWYQPSKDCSTERLSEAQKSVLKEMDQRIAAARK